MKYSKKTYPYTDVGMKNCSKLSRWEIPMRPDRPETGGIRLCSPVLYADQNNVSSLQFRRLRKS